MSNMIGANLDELTQLSAQFRSSAERLLSLRQQIEGIINAAWAGPDAERFRQAWAAGHRAALQAAADGLEQARRDIDRQRGEQEQASGIATNASPVGPAIGHVGRPAEGSSPWRAAGMGFGAVDALIAPIGALGSALEFARNVKVGGSVARGLERQQQVIDCNAASSLGSAGHRWVGDH